MLAGNFFDGRSSLRHPVSLRLDGDQLLIDGAPIRRSYALSSLDVGECLDGGALTLRLPDGACCEIAQGPAFEAMIGAAGRRTPLLLRMQRHAGWALAALALFGALVLAAYFWGLPRAAEALAPRLPAAGVERLGNQVLQLLDRSGLKASRLAADRQAAIRARLAEFGAATRLPAHRLLFRAAPGMGANAFALPGGSVVLLDGLVEQASDDQVIAVIAHELGHVAEYHTLRRLIQDAVVSTAVAAYFGDVSSAAASVATLALNAGYSRDFELAADRFAAERLVEAGYDPLLLVELLKKISHPGRDASLLASHPDTTARAAAIRRFAAERRPSCPPAPSLR